MVMLVGDGDPDFLCDHMLQNYIIGTRADDGAGRKEPHAEVSQAGNGGRPIPQRYMVRMIILRRHRRKIPK
jgi:hypothetical protein